MTCFVHTVPVRFHEVDSAGIVFFARFFQYAHDAYEAWLQSIGFGLEVSFEERGYGFPLVHAEADFRAPIRVGQEIRIELKPISAGTTSFTVRAQLALSDGREVATVTTVHVCVEPATGRPRPLPEPFRTALSPYLE